MVFEFLVGVDTIGFRGFCGLGSLLVVLRLPVFVAVCVWVFYFGCGVSRWLGLPEGFGLVWGWYDIVLWPLGG